jgi:glycerophosphoryl diester phosphodiesterase
VHRLLPWYQGTQRDLRHQATIVGHRGFGSGPRAGFRESTVSSFLAAAACGLKWVELDVRRSCDGQLAP